MAEAGVERRLTTILAADVVGYSRLMAADVFEDRRLDLPSQVAISVDQQIRAVDAALEAQSSKRPSRNRREQEPSLDLCHRS